MNPLPLIHAAIFTTSFIVARLRGPKWRALDWAVVLWGTSYVVGFEALLGLGIQTTQLVFGTAPESEATWCMTMVVAIGLPGMFTALLVGWAYRNWRVVGWIGLAAFAAIGVAVASKEFSPLAAPFVWHPITVLTLFHYRARPGPPPQVPEPRCTICGYPWKGLPQGALCPECGTARHENSSDTNSV